MKVRVSCFGAIDLPGTDGDVPIGVAPIVQRGEGLIRDHSTFPRADKLLQIFSHSPGYDALCNTDVAT